MLSIRGLHAGYGRSAVLQGVDLDVPAGTVMALMGRNGMGKTTLLRTIMGLLAARRGSVRFSDREITRRRPHEIARAGLAWVPQGRDIFADFTVAENLRLGVIGQPGRNVVPAEIYDRLPILSARRDQRAGTLSAGEQQLLAIGRALAAAPAMLLLDEPTEGLQPSIVYEIGDLLAGFVAESNVTILIAEQNIDLAMTVAQSIAFMDRGVIAEVVPTNEAAADEFLFTKHLLL